MTTRKTMTMNNDSLLQKTFFLQKSIHITWLTILKATKYNVRGQSLVITQIKDSILIGSLSCLLVLLPT